MKNKRFLTCLLVGLTVPSMVLPGSAYAEEAASAKYSVETSSLGDLLDDPAAKAVLEKHLPGLVGNGQIEMARGLTLKALQSYAGDMVTDEALAKVQADLDKLPAKH